jgi:hypothetical protein
MSAIRRISVRLGSAAISFAPRVIARLICLPIMGWVAVALLPMTKIQAASPISEIEFVMAPLPKVVARPATVGECQRRAQWSILFVPITVLTNF